MPRKTQQKTQIADRRGKVSALYLRGYKQAAIAEQLGVTQGTISNDINALLDEWREDRLQNIEDAVSRQIEELREIRKSAWAEWVKSKEAKWLEVVMKAQDREAKLLGLYAPDRLDLTSGNEPFQFVVKFETDGDSIQPGDYA